MNRPRMNVRGRAVALLLSLSSGVLPGLALAQINNGVLTGTATDAATKQPVTDVVVTATSPALQGEQVVLTDGTGLYRIPQLPPGDYTLRFEKESYKPYARTGVHLRSGQTLRLNVELLPEALRAEEIIVVGKAPTVDVGSSRTGVSVSSDFIHNIATARPGGKGSAARSFESLADVAPQANADPFGVSVNGATSPENGFIIDGLSAGSPAVGILGTPLTQEFVQEVNVITGGYMPEYGRSTGGILTAITKSGSNEFHGSVWGNLTPGIFEGPRAAVTSAGSVITTTQRLWNLGDFGGELGGPILKDKLWFYVGVAPSFTRRQVESNFNFISTDSAGNRVFNPIPNTTRDYFADQRSLQYIAKLTYLLTSDHRLTLSVYGAPTTSGGHGTFAYTLDEGFLEVDNPNGQQGLTGQFGALAHINTQDSRDISLKLSSSFLDKRLLLDATLGWHHQTNQSLPSDGTAIGSSDGLAGIPQFLMRRTTPGFRSLNDFEVLPDPSVCDPAGTPNATRCPVSSYLIGGPGFLVQNQLERYQANVVGTYFLSALGHHVVKAGADVELLTDNDERAYSGLRFDREAVDGTYFQDFRSYGYLRGPDDVVIQPSAISSTRALTAGGFVQDSWTIMDLVTLNAGIRYDDQTITGGNGRTAFRLGNQFSPRVGVIYDFTQQGRSKLFANYARFYENAVLAMFNSQFSNVTRMTAYRSTTPTAKGGPGCNPLAQQAPYTECGDENNLLTLSQPPIRSVYPEDLSQKYQQSFAINSPVDPNLQPQSSDEIVLGGEYEVLANARAGLSYTKRYVNDVIEDMSRNQATNYFIGNPGKGVATDFPIARRDYDAVTVYFNKAFADLWLAQGSYTFSYLRGNYSGLFRPENGQLAPNVTSDFDLPSLTINHEGALPLDHTHSVKAFVAKEFIVTGGASVSIGLSYRGISGAPTNVTASHPIYGPGFAFLLPRGSGDRLPWVHNVDTHLGLNYRITKDSVATVSLDVFNLFNFQAATGQDENYSFDNVNQDPANLPTDLTQVVNTSGKPLTVNPNFGHPTSYQPPRSIRIGARVTF